MWRLINPSVLRLGRLVSTRPTKFLGENDQPECSGQIEKVGRGRSTRTEDSKNVNVSNGLGCLEVVGVSFADRQFKPVNVPVRNVVP